MWVKMKKTGNKGFSLVELMVVVAIITILAGLAIPKFRNFQAKARQAEAKTNLSHIYTLQESFYADANAYWPAGAGAPPAGVLSLANFAGAATCRQNNALGFYVSDCTRVRYTYTATSPNNNQFTGTATEINGATPGTRRVFPGCAAAGAGGAGDQWIIDEDKFLRSDDGPTGLVALCN